MRSLGPPGGLIGWQTLLADLSLILFMVTAAAMAGSPEEQRQLRELAPRTHGTCCTVERSQPAEPLALWRAGGQQTLGHWLAGEQPDARQKLTITTRYERGDAARALAKTRGLIEEAGAKGADARLILIPGAPGEAVQTTASLAYDHAP